MANVAGVAYHTRRQNVDDGLAFSVCEQRFIILLRNGLIMLVPLRLRVSSQNQRTSINFVSKRTRPMRNESTALTNDLHPNSYQANILPQIIL